MSESVLFPSLYEEDYILRSLGSIVNHPDVALTELVANAWDAGASNVTISIPESTNQVLSIEDDGTGLTESEFEKRWMTLRYNRIKGQGKKVVFPNNLGSVRYAFGHNGVGRHGLFCFGSEYKVITSKDGYRRTYKIKPNVNNLPFAVIDSKEEYSDKNGTRLEVIVTKNLPNPQKVIQVISARFLQDPQFKITVNHTTLNLEDFTGDVEPQTIKINNGKIKLECYFIDTTKAARKSIFQGIAFWQSGRLVGEPTWTLGKNLVLDGRTMLAKRYTIIVKTNDLSDEIKEDWTGFRTSETMGLVYEEVEKYVNLCIESISSATISIVKENLGTSIKESLKKVNPLVGLEIDEVISNIVNENPKVKQESVDIAVQAVINIEKSKSGQALLEKLSVLSTNDLDSLNELLSKWTVGDALVVLNEIDRRLSIISAIRKLAGDKLTDELHVLHPLITESRWLFGPEYESSEYIFNRQMKTAVGNLFGKDKFSSPDTNYKKRPDLICLPHSTIGVTGIEEISDSLNLSSVRKILLIELKKGGFKISREERNQAQGYVDDLRASNLGPNCTITAYVVGDSVASNVTSPINVGGNNEGTIYITTYDQLVDTAERRMFGLRQTIASRYDDVPGMELYAQSKLFI